MHLKLTPEDFGHLEQLQKELHTVFQASVELNADTCIQRRSNEPLTAEQGKLLLELAASMANLCGPFEQTLRSIAKNNDLPFEAAPSSELYRPSR